ncbi:hypothetical protein MTP99_013845 [Tenebrio molitor]|nr:hypothetical protein MTP99_013845 [Tenebrio molitor]
MVRSALITRRSGGSCGRTMARKPYTANKANSQPLEVLPALVSTITVFQDAILHVPGRFGDRLFVRINFLS